MSKKDKKKGRKKDQKREKKKQKLAAQKRIHASKKKKRYGLGNSVLSESEMRALGIKIQNGEPAEAPPEEEADLLEDSPTEFITGKK